MHFLIIRLPARGMKPSLSLPMSKSMLTRFSVISETLKRVNSMTLRSLKDSPSQDQVKRLPPLKMEEMMTKRKTSILPPLEISSNIWEQEKLSLKFCQRIRVGWVPMPGKLVREIGVYVWMWMC